MGGLLVMFLTIFVAELGDKTQIATLLFASERQNSPWIVFAASAGALVLGAAISVALGAFGGRYLEHIPLKLIAGIGFIAIGAWSVVQYYRGG
jgi:putative Ca2+/H+ antiporter (TMEM165/GDT1 family)